MKDEMKVEMSKSNFANLNEFLYLRGADVWTILHKITSWLLNIVYIMTINLLGSTIYIKEAFNIIIMKRNC